MATFVIVHGAHSGGGIWQLVRNRLRLGIGLKFRRTLSPILTTLVACCRLHNKTEKERNTYA